MTKQFHSIFFDCDSTLVKAEGLDMLADMCGVGEEVKRMTELSMNGEVPMEEVFERKVKLMSPHLSKIQELIPQYVELIIDDAIEVIRALHLLKKKIYILTSNFHHIVDPVAEALGIKEEHVIANHLFFDSEGNYVGMSTDSPLAKDGGKARALEHYLVEGERIVCIGDGMTDLACKEVAHLFIGFGGVKERRKVKEEAHAYVSAPSLAPLLFLILTPQEIAKLAKDRHMRILIDKAHSLASMTTRSQVSLTS